MSQKKGHSARSGVKTHRWGHGLIRPDAQHAHHDVMAMFNSTTASSCDVIDHLTLHLKHDRARNQTVRTHLLDSDLTRGHFDLQIDFLADLNHPHGAPPRPVQITIGREHGQGFGLGRKLHFQRFAVARPH